MKRSLFFWILAFLITVGSAMYQRMTGPTYPVSGRVSMNGKEIAYSLKRSEESTGNHKIQIRTDDPAIHGYAEWRRYKTSDDWIRVVMNYENGILSAELPQQPPAGKLQYHVSLQNSAQTITIPAEGQVIIRFKGAVPLAVLLLHIIVIFSAMLFSARTGIETFAHEPKYKNLTYWTVALLVAGGFILGPIVQKYAFDAYWTGWPFGTDLTDNKMAAAIFSWIAAAVALKKSPNPKRWILFAALMTLLIFLIPHSMYGSELDYSKMK
ncbi:MAG: hypothetical protein EHM64_05180 [Ignavibacteriae bacterium]|nr:MAG: hypothetical protein EHM64_05180 [Ignavibacteriota bacterium]